MTFSGKMLNFFETKYKEMMVVSTLMMMTALVWTMAIMVMPLKTNEASFFMDNDDEIFEDDIPLGLWQGDKDEIILCPFSDCADHWAKKQIVKVTEAEIMSPITETEFRPNVKVTRAEFVTTLGRLENIDTTGRKVKSFNDVNSNKFYTPYIAWAEENGILANENNKKFRPDDFITREEMATMLCKYLVNVREAILTGGLDFIDQDKISLWARDYISLVSGMDFVSGRTDGSFDPKAGVTRAELATLLVRIMEEFNL